MRDWKREGERRGRREGEREGLQRSFGWNEHDKHEGAEG